MHWHNRYLATYSLSCLENYITRACSTVLGPLGGLAQVAGLTDSTSRLLVPLIRLSTVGCTAELSQLLVPTPCLERPARGDDISTVTDDFYCAMLRVARYCQGKLSVCLSVRLSVTLRYCDHIGWTSVKIISRLISLTISLCVEPNMTDLLQREHPQILAGIEVG